MWNWVVWKMLKENRPFQKMNSYDWLSVKDLEFIDLFWGVDVRKLDVGWKMDEIMWWARNRSENVLKLLIDTFLLILSFKHFCLFFSKFHHFQRIFGKNLLRFTYLTYFKQRFHQIPLIIFIFRRQNFFKAENIKIDFDKHITYLLYYFLVFVVIFVYFFIFWYVFFNKLIFVKVEYRNEIFSHFCILRFHKSLHKLKLQNFLNHIFTTQKLFDLILRIFAFFNQMKTKLKDVVFFIFATKLKFTHFF